MMVGGRSLVIGALVLVAIVAWWGGLWWQLQDSALTRVLRLDEAYYMDRAVEIRAGTLLPDDGFYMSPLYPYVIAAAGSARELDAGGVLRGTPPWGIRTLQALLWLGTALLVWQVGRRLLPVRWAWLPAGLFILYRPAAILANTLLLEVTLTFCVMGFLALLLSVAAGRASWTLCGMLGVVAGIAMLLRGTSIALLAVGTIALAVGARGRGRIWVPRAGLMVVTTFVVVLPAIAHNSSRAGRLVGPSLNGGINLYVGNGPEANGLFRTNREHDFINDPTGEEWLTRKIGHPVRGAADADRQWTRLALESIREDPLRAARLWLRKVWLHLAGFEISQITPLDLWSRQANLLTFLVVPYRLIAAAGLAGLLWLGWREPRWLPLAAGVVLLIGLQSLFFVTTRYRLAIVPPLALLAGGFFVSLLRARGRRLASGLGLAAACAFVVVPWGMGPTVAELRSAGLANLAIRWVYLGERLEAEDRPAAAREAWYEALRLFQTRIRDAPADADAYRGLSRAHFFLGDIPRAEAVLTAGTAASTDTRALQADRILLMLETDRRDAALELLSAYLTRHADDAEMWHHYVLTLAGQGRLEDARSAARRMLAEVPTEPRAYSDLGVILARSGRLEEARQVLETGLRRFPRDEVIRANLDRVRQDLEGGP